MNLLSRFITLGALCLLGVFSVEVRAQPPAPAIQQALPPAEAPFLPIITWDELQRQIGGPSLVTLHARTMPALQALDELVKQTPVPARVQSRSSWQGDDQTLLSGDYERQPYWRAVRDIGEKLDARAYSYGGRNLMFVQSFGLGSDAEQEGFVVESGPAILTLLNAEYSSKMRLKLENGDAPTAADKNLNLSGRIYLDPKLAVLERGLAIHLEEASDERGASLLLNPNEETSAEVVASTYGVPGKLILPLKPPARQGGKLAQLRGSLHGAVASKSQVWEVDDVLNVKNVAQVFELDGKPERYELQEAKADGVERYRVRIVVSQPGVFDRQSARLSTGKELFLTSSNAISYNLRLIDSDGREMWRQGAGAERNTEEGNKENPLTVITAIFGRGEGETAPVGKPAKLLLTLPYDWRELIVPFSFQNIPLP